MKVGPPYDGLHPPLLSMFRLEYLLWIAQTPLSRLSQPVLHQLFKSDSQFHVFESQIAMRYEKIPGLSTRNLILSTMCRILKVLVKNVPHLPNLITNGSAIWVWSWWYYWLLHLQGWHLAVIQLVSVAFVGPKWPVKIKNKMSKYSNIIVIVWSFL